MYGCFLIFMLCVVGPAGVIAGVIIGWREYGCWGLFLGIPAGLIGGWLLAYASILAVMLPVSVAGVVFQWVAAVVDGRQPEPLWRPKNAIEYAAVGVGVAGAIGGAVLGNEWGATLGAVLGAPLGASALLVVTTAVAMVAVTSAGAIHRKFRGPQPNNDSAGDAGVENEQTKTDEPGEAPEQRE